jgi:hypothetical protein
MNNQDISAIDFFLLGYLCLLLACLLPLLGLIVALGCALVSPALLFLTLRQLCLRMIGPGITARPVPAAKEVETRG